VRRLVAAIPLARRRCRGEEGRLVWLGAVHQSHRFPHAQLTEQAPGQRLCPLEVVLRSAPATVSSPLRSAQPNDARASGV
jgi:hypothetical protein